MQITINIKDGTKAKAFLNFIKSLDFVTVKEHDENLAYPAMTEKEIVNRVAITDKQIKEGQTVSHKDLFNESQNW